MITPPPLIDVKPGDAITSEQWNNILAALRTVYDALNKTFGLISINVRNRADGNPLTDATVTLLPKGRDERPARAAQFVGGAVNRYQVLQLPPGEYDVVVEAGGFGVERRTVTMEASGTLELTIEMTPAEVLVAMPNLFGRALGTALDIVRQSQLQVGRIIDSHGTDIPPGRVPAEAAQQAVVLNQVPEAETPVAKNTPLLLHVSAKAEFTERVRVPDLSGLTLEEAKRKLEAARLVLGRTNTVTTKGADTANTR